MNKKTKNIAIFIAYKAENDLEQFWEVFPKKYFDEVILVDDASCDKTYKIARKLKGLKAYQNPTNLGYGGNLKKAISIALDHGADIIVDIHPDGEYKPSAIPLAIEKIQNEGYELIIGNRFTTLLAPLKNGMYLWKVPPILLLSLIDRIILKIKISDYHQGFRVYTKNLLKKISFEKNKNNYLFSFEIIVQAVIAKIKIGEVPVEVIYEGKKRGANLKNCIIYSLGTFKVLVLYLLTKIGIVAPILKRPRSSIKNRVSKLI